MTDTAAREEAVERVRAAFAEAEQRVERAAKHIALMPESLDQARKDKAEFMTVAVGFNDLRLLLSGGEGGSVASLPVMTADEPATPLSAALLTAVELLLNRWRRYRKSDLSHYDAHNWLADHAPWQALEDAFMAVPPALTDPRQPSEAAFDIGAFIAGYVMAVEKRHKGPWEGIYGYAALAGEEWHQEGRKPVETTGMIMVADMETASLPKPPTGEGGGVEEALRDALECIVGLQEMPAKTWDERWPRWAERWAALAGQEDRAHLLSCEIAEAALSPRSADGLCSLAAKDGAAAPPQAPVAGSEDAASKVAG